MNVEGNIRLAFSVFSNRISPSRASFLVTSKEFFLRQWRSEGVYLNCLLESSFYVADPFVCLPLWCVSTPSSHEQRIFSLKLFLPTQSKRKIVENSNETFLFPNHLLCSPEHTLKTHYKNDKTMQRIESETKTQSTRDENRSWSERILRW